ncbi:MAG: DUF6387 family protein [Methylobacter sp.]|nr:DUF6387 family protein [Methylobacter sp.]
MTEELDTSWFDLKNYDKFKDLDLEGWKEQLTNRWYYYLVVDICNIALPFSINDFTVEQLIDKSKPKHSVYSEDFDEDSYQGFPVESQLIAIITNLKQGNADESCTILSMPEAPSVYDVSGLDVYNMALKCGILNMLDSDFDERVSEMNRQPVTDFDGTFTVNIDLHATDEQIKYEFSQWLANYRKTATFKAQKKLIAQKDFDYWNKYGVIPYLDLMLLAKIEGKKITQHKLAKLIFPNEYDIDITGRIRETTKPEADRLIDNRIHKMLTIQLAHEISEMKST